MLLFTVGTALVLAVTGGLFYLQLRGSLRSSLDASLQARSDALATRLTGARQVDDATVAIAGADTQLIEASGRVVAAAPRSDTVPFLPSDRLAAARIAPELVTVRVGEDQMRVLAGPVTLAGGRRDVLAVGAATDLIDVSEDRVRDIMFLACGPMMVLAGAAAWALSGAALRPVERMRRQAAELGVADAGGRLAVPTTRDEIAALARTLNDLLSRMHDARERDRAFIADAGHELRTPLTILKAELELASRPGRDRDELVEAVAGAAAETERLVRLAEALLALARFDAEPAEIHREPVDLAELLGGATRAAGSAARVAGVGFRLDVDCPPPVAVDGDRVRQAVDNLIANAIRYSPAGSTIEIAARARTRPGPAGEPAVQLTVRDHGSGFPPAFLPHAFERFSRADDARGRDEGGAGLGLPIVAAIAAAHGGGAAAANHPDGGAIVTVTLGLERGPEPEPPAAGDRWAGDETRL